MERICKSVKNNFISNFRLTMNNNNRNNPMKYAAKFGGMNREQATSNWSTHTPHNHMQHDVAKPRILACFQQHFRKLPRRSRSPSMWHNENV